MNNKNLQPQMLEMAITALYDINTRHDFIQELSNQRGQNQNELKDIQFIIMQHLFLKAFDYIDQQSKLKSIDNDTLLLVNMSLTYYRKIKIQKNEYKKNNNQPDRRQYIAETIKDHPCFSDFSFWYQSFKKEAKQKFKEQLRYQYQISQKDLSTTETLTENQEYQEMYRFTKISTLQFYAVAFEELGRTKQDYIQFVDFVQEKFSINLNQQERDELIDCYKIKPKFQENDIDKLKYKQQEREILHNFQLAKQMALERKNNKEEFNKMISQIQIAEILDSQQDETNIIDIFDSDLQMQKSVEQQFNIYNLKLPDNFQQQWL